MLILENTVESIETKCWSLMNLCSLFKCFSLFTYFENKNKQVAYHVSLVIENVLMETQITSTETRMSYILVSLLVSLLPLIYGKSLNNVELPAVAGCSTTPFRHRK